MVCSSGCWSSLRHGEACVGSRELSRGQKKEEKRGSHMVESQAPREDRGEEECWPNPGTE